MMNFSDDVKKDIDIEKGENNFSKLKETLKKNQGVDCKKENAIFSFSDGNNKLM